MCGIVFCEESPWTEPALDDKTAKRELEAEYPVYMAYWPNGIGN